VPAVCADKAVRRYLALCTAKVKSRWVRCLLSSTEMCGTGTGAVHMQPVRRGEHQGGQPARVGERVRVCALRRLPRHPQAHRCARSRWRCSDSASQRSSACARRKRRRDARPCMKRCEQWCLCANRPGPCSWAGCIGGPRWWYELRVVLSWPVARADNLKLFHELAGPVYPPRKISTLRIPPGYPQQPLLDSQLPPEAWGDEVL
jgi:hypothetical protein